jgi:predicted dehydrogenase
MRESSLSINPLVGWGILGTGAIARSFVRDLALLSDARIAAVGSRSLESARAFSSAHPSDGHTARAYGSYEEMSEDPGVDIVYVATPHSMHLENVQMCLNAGKPVLCEKAFALNAAQTLQMIHLAADKELFLMEAMWMRCNPVIRQLREVALGGAIGEVRQVTADLSFQPVQPAKSRLYDPELGASALLDIGIYPVTFAALILGEPAGIAAWADVSERGVDVHTGVTLGYTSGAVAALTCSMTAQSSNVATVSGTRGRIDVPARFHHPSRFTLHHDGTTQMYETQLRGTGLSYEAEEAQRCLREGLRESPLVPLADTLSVMTVLDSIRAEIGVTYQADVDAPT